MLWTDSFEAKPLSGTRSANRRNMPDLAASIEPPSSRAIPEVCKRFDICAEHALQLELRIDAFSRALDVRGGRVVDVERSQKPEGGHLASVQYTLPLPLSKSALRV